MSRVLDKAGIAALIPHAGAMCLLDAVVSWDATSIACLASSHRDPANPLAADGRLEAICGIEYAAQAMAVHGGLANRGSGEGGLADGGLADGGMAAGGPADGGLAAGGLPEGGLANGGLAAGGRRPAAGYLASTRDVVCAVERLDRLAGDLRVTAELLLPGSTRVIYRFALTCDGAQVLSGRAAVVLDAGPA